jgi:phosphatidylglycerophosphate synthase
MKKPTKPIKGETFIHTIFRYFSFLLVAKVLWNTKITPNQITVFRTLLNAISLYLFTFLDWRYILGFIIFQFAEMLDSTDGDIARYKGLKSRMGIWLEIFFDSILTPIWGMIGLIFAYISYSIDGNIIYFILWGLIGFSNNLEKTFYINFARKKQSFDHAVHDSIYFGFKGEPLEKKVKNFIIVSKSWENQWLVIAGLIYVVSGINLFLYIWIWLLFLSQIHWIRLAYKGYMDAKI